MTGRPVAVPANSSDVWRAARFALSEFNRADDEDLFAYKIINITSAKIQVKKKLYSTASVAISRPAEANTQTNVVHKMPDKSSVVIL